MGNFTECDLTVSRCLRMPPTQLLLPTAAQHQDHLLEAATKPSAHTEFTILATAARVVASLLLVPSLLLLLTD